MRALFMGTPAPAVPTLEALVDVADVVAVVTQPDRRRGRSGTPQPPAVKSAALALGLPVRQPGDRVELAAVMAEMGDVAIGVVVAFGMILEPAVLDIPDAGFINVHFSLLPRWRGAAPVERAILAGDETTGVSLMAMDAGLDTGPLIATWSTEIGGDETAGDLTHRLALAGAELAATTLVPWVNGAIEGVPQAPEGVTYAPKLSTDQARLDFNQTAVDLERAVRAFNPRPGAWTSAGDRLKIWSAAVGPSLSEAPGTVVPDGDVVRVATGLGSLVLGEVQPAGSGRMAASAWWRGARLPVGTRLE